MALLKIRETIFSEYADQRGCLKKSQIQEMLDGGEALLSRCDLTNTLAKGGAALFPHTSILHCGEQIAAVALASLRACQNSGKNQILALGVLHGIKDPLFSIYPRERAGENLLREPLRRVFGPGLPHEHLIAEEYSLDNYHFLLPYAAQRLNMDLPKVISRYPVFVCGEPTSLPGIEELEQIVRESIIVATSDLYHHGIAYDFSQEKAMPVSPAAYDLAQRIIEGALSFFTGDNLLAFRKYCWDNRSDARDVGQILSFFLGPLKGYVRDLKLVNVESLFDGNTTPSWVAASLVELVSCPR